MRTFGIFGDLDLTHFPFTAMLTVDCLSKLQTSSICLSCNQTVLILALPTRTRLLNPLQVMFRTY